MYCHVGVVLYLCVLSVNHSSGASSSETASSTSSPPPASPFAAGFADCFRYISANLRSRQHQRPFGAAARPTARPSSLVPTTCPPSVE